MLLRVLNQDLISTRELIKFYLSCKNKLVEKLFKIKYPWASFKKWVGKKTFRTSLE